MFSTAGKSISDIVFAAVAVGDNNGVMDKAHAEIQQLLLATKSLQGFHPMQRFQGVCTYSRVGLVFQFNLARVSKQVRTDISVTFVYCNEDKAIRVSAAADSYLNTTETFTVHVGNVTSALCKMSELDTAFDSYFLAKLMQTVGKQVNDFKHATGWSIWKSITAVFKRGARLA